MDVETEKISIAQYTEEAYLNYAMYVVNDRAFHSSVTDWKPLTKANHPCYECLAAFPRR